MSKKHNHYWNLIPLIVITIILIKSIFSIESILSGFFSTTLSILMPFFWAFGIAYLLNPLSILLEKKFNLKRSMSIVLTYLITIVVLIFLTLVIFPTIIESISDLARNLSHYINTAQGFITESLSKISKASPDITQQIENIFLSTVSHIAEFLTEFMKGLLGQTIRFTSSFIKFIFGFIISIYMLVEKDKIKLFFKKFLRAVLPNEKSDFTIEFLSKSNVIFSKFIIGKTIDSLIIGILCYIGLIIIKAPFAILIALIVGVTNMIPYFGPFIGMVPAFILTLFVNPKLAFIVLFYIFLLQQFDGWYLGPKILGDQVGVSPLLIILVGIFCKAFWLERFTKLSTILYIAMGWLIIFNVGNLIRIVPIEAVFLLALGGISYTAGCLFFVKDKWRFNHAIWHIFVLLGSALQYFSMLFII